MLSILGYIIDNDITQLIRHTIEYIAKLVGGNEVLNIDRATQDAILQIKRATVTFDPNGRQSIINKNLRPIVHPYYSEYTALQRLCLQILRHEELKYGQEKNEIYGVLIDAAWLWEEYLAIVLESKFKHYQKDLGKRFYLFKPNKQQIIPDYLSIDRKIVADAKYIPLNEKRWFGEEKATAIYYKTITYMYRFCSKNGYLLYPNPRGTSSLLEDIQTEIEGINGGTITKLGLGIPNNCSSFDDFSVKMREMEQEFFDQL